MVNEHNLFGVGGSLEIPEMPENPSDDELIMRAAWLGSLDPRDALFRSRGETRPIMGSPFDQRVPKGVHNPFWEIIRRLPAVPGIWNPILEPDGFMGTFALGTKVSLEVMRKPGWDALQRMELCQRYSWAIASPGSVKFIADYLCGKPLVEICAGSGYWAWQLSQIGVAVDAYDPNPPDPENWFNKHRLYFDVKQDDHTVAGGYPDRALMICWPCYEDGYAAEAVSLYGGDTIVYIGEGPGGCCADDEFFAILDTDWDLDGSYYGHTRWSGLHDVLEIYRRKGVEK